MSKINILFHRGDIIKFEENTLNSIIDIQKNDIINDSNYNFGCEFDIQLTKDNTFVCYHDKNIKNTNYVIEEVNFKLHQPEFKMKQQ
jgi:glycerophosphoryl diester phosphodiesterase